MKVLTIRQPYANLIAEGIKGVENRSQKTNYRGKFLIHAAAKFHDRAKTGDLYTDHQTIAIAATLKSVESVIEKFNISKTIYPLGAIIGEAEIVGCTQNNSSIWAEPGQWHWEIKNAVLYKTPVLDIKGKLGLWNLDFCPTCKKVAEIYDCEQCEGLYCDSCKAIFTIHNQCDKNMCNACQQAINQHD